jgi:hypothetical protein
MRFIEWIAAAAVGALGCSSSADEDLEAWAAALDAGRKEASGEGADAGPIANEERGADEGGSAVHDVPQDAGELTEDSGSGGGASAGGATSIAVCDGTAHDGRCPAGCFADTDRDCATIAATGRFDLASDGLHVFGPKKLTDTKTVMQGIAWDNVHHVVYIAQVTGADKSTYAEHVAHGDLTITKLTDDGTVVSSMRLTRSGHGVSIGAEPEGAGVYLWVEADSAATSDGDIRGTALARVKYAPGATIDMAGYPARFWPAADAHKTAPEYTCNVDMATGRIAVRYVHKSGGFRIALYSLDDVKRGGNAPLIAPIALPSGLGTFQGYATYGSFAYVLTGTPSEDDTMLYSFDWTTGGMKQKAGTAVFGSAVAREPEGMSVQEYDGVRRLTFGFASHKSASDDTRMANVAYKDGWIR